MKKFFFLFFILGNIYLNAQDITCIPQDTLLVDTLNSEMAFIINITNVSMQDQTIYLVRSQNDLPADWQSSLCFDFCWAPHIDSIATTPDFQSNPLTPNEHREVSLHVFPVNNFGTGHCQIKVGTFKTSTVAYVINLTATVLATGVNDETLQLNDFSLSQNYPNPFNPSTKISWQSSVSSWQTIKIYDMLGREVASLVDEFKPVGNYEVEFDGKNLPSGIYLYRLTAGSFSQTRKMILEK